MTKYDLAAHKQSSTLTERQLRSLPFLVGPGSLEEGRKAAKVSKDALYRWLRQPAFRAELRRQRDLVVTDALDVLKNRVIQAVEVLAELLGSQSEVIRRGAACDILNYVLKIRETQDFEDRLEACERALANNPSSGDGHDQ